MAPATGPAAVLSPAIPADSRERAATSAVAALFGATVFLSAFLLFQVQPLVGKRILPWFGGTPAVWMTCMLFFQVVLLAGYACAHALARGSRPAQVLGHGALLALALVSLPLAPARPASAPAGGDPTLEILVLLARSVGLPFLALATTAPLLQSWFATLLPGRRFYRLYALSNAGSLLALVSYPLVVERNLTLAGQAGVWSAGMVLFLAGSAICGLLALRAGGARDTAPTALRSGAARGRPAALDVLLWIALAACGSAMLLATTNQLCQNVAPVPFLWVLPLCLYLASFVLCFDAEGWYRRRAFTWALVVVLAGMPLLAATSPDLGLVAYVAAYSAALFVVCMCAHGELVRIKPPARHVTAFYLAVSVGGALGGAFVSLAAPVLFDGYWEFLLGLFATAVVVLLARRRDSLTAALTTGRLRALPRPLLVLAGVVGPLAGLLVGSFAMNVLFTRSALSMTRNFYGVLRLTEVDASSPERHRLLLTHGTTVHGSQFADPALRLRPTTYYAETSGVGLAIERLRREHPEGLRIGVVGLGVGTVAAYTRSGDRLRFYEIDRDVVELAETRFHYLADARGRGAEVSVAVGDGRLALEQELAAEGSRAFDLLVVDAFSSDAIPIHLLTGECLETYRAHLAPDGLVAVHVSNRYLDLGPVVGRLARQVGRLACRIDDAGDPERDAHESSWVLLATDAGPAWERCSPPGDDAPLWTDDHSSLVPILR